MFQTIYMMVFFMVGCGVGGISLWLVYKTKVALLSQHIETQNQHVNQLQTTFEALSSKALRDNNASFLELAEQNFQTLQVKAKGDLDQKEQAIHNLVQPVKELLQKFDAQVQHIETKREGAYAGISQQLETLHKINSDLRHQTTSLSQAMKSTKYSGSWGEYQLRNLVEMAGMSPYCDFEEQKSNEDAKRPDLIVRLPNDRKIVVDAKAPLVSLHNAMTATSEDDKKIKLKEYSKHVRAHINGLSMKKYWDSVGGSADFVLMFLPTETMLTIALKQDPELIE